jgi:CheY-like chemotaxis protein
MTIRRPSVLLAVTDDGVLDLLRGLFEAHDCLVAAAGTVRGCAGVMERQPIDAVVTTWDDPLGRHLHAWTIDHHRELRRRFVFVVDEGTVAGGISGRERTVRLDDLDGLLAEVTRLAGPALASGTPVPVRSRLLLVEDDQPQLDVMTALLDAMGFSVTGATGALATLLLEADQYDVILCDWNGAGDAVYSWIHARQPELLSRLVVMTDGDVDDVQLQVGDVAVVPKGQDSQYLIAELSRAGGGRG